MTATVTQTATVRCARCGETATCEVQLDVLRTGHSFAQSTGAVVELPEGWRWDSSDGPYTAVPVCPCAGRPS